MTTARRRRPERRVDASSVADASGGAGSHALWSRIQEVRQQLLAPPPRLTISEWADRYRVVSSYSADPGAWQTSRTPYLREIMDALCDPAVTMVALQKCARIGGTEAALNVIGYYIAHDPSSILVVQPTVDDAKDFSKEHIASMIADTPALRALVREPRARDSGNTVVAKLYPGGAIYLVGANSARGFRRRSARVLILEEIDAYPATAGSEGDPISLAIRRTTTFGPRRKIFLNSTPTLKGESPIERYAREGDRRHYHVRCPLCAAAQPLEWRSLQLREAGGPVYRCRACAGPWAETMKGQLLASGVWIPERPDAPYRSYYLNALYSPWITWADLAAEWWAAQEQTTALQVFVNTALGETWEDRAGGVLTVAQLLSRTEAYQTPAPAGVGVITAGIDVQDDRVEVVVRGWGAGEESWLLAWERIMGGPSDPAVWAALDAILRRRYRTPSGRMLGVLAAGIDTGAHTETVYAYCRPRLGWRLFPLKGSSTPGAPLVPRRPSRNNRGGLPLYLIGTGAAKDLIYSRLRLQVPGPGYQHLPADLDPTYCDQITAEIVVRRQVAGRWQRRYLLPRGRRNEALDCEVYALAALYLAPVARHDLGRLASQYSTPTAEAEPEAAASGEVAPPPPPGADRPAPPTLAVVPAAPRAVGRPRPAVRPWTLRW